MEMTEAIATIMRARPTVTAVESGMTVYVTGNIKTRDSGHFAYVMPDSLDGMTDENVNDLLIGLMFGKDA